jgi:hypothetical protein
MSVIECRLNGRVVQKASTADLLMGVADLIAFLSTFATLRPRVGRKVPVRQVSDIESLFADYERAATTHIGEPHRPQSYDSSRTTSTRCKAGVGGYP